MLQKIEGHYKGANHKESTFDFTWDDDFESSSSKPDTKNCLSYFPRFKISKARKSLTFDFNSLWTAISLFLAVCIENLPRSEVIHFRPSFSATAAVVPEPQKKSQTIS